MLDRLARFDRWLVLHWHDFVCEVVGHDWPTPSRDMVCRRCGRRPFYPVSHTLHD